MGAIEHLTISLPVEMAETVRGWVTDGEFSDVNAAVLEALRELAAGGAAALDPKVENWVRREVLPAIDRYDADRSRGLTVDQVRDRLAQAPWARDDVRC